MAVSLQKLSGSLNSLNIEVQIFKQNILAANRALGELIIRIPLLPFIAEKSEANVGSALLQVKRPV